MASSIECATFALGVLGHAFRPDIFPKFHDLKRRIRGWSYKDVIDMPRTQKSPKVQYSAFTLAFPKLQAKWIERSVLINEIFEYHNHSKHRAEGFSGNGFYDIEDFPELWNQEKSTGTSDAGHNRSSWQSVTVPQVPGKKHYEYRTIEDLSLAYSGLLLQSGREALADAHHLPDIRVKQP